MLRHVHAKHRCETHVRAMAMVMERQHAPRWACAGIRSPKASSGDCVNRLAQISILRMEREVDNQVAAPNENAQLAPSENRTSKSADGRVATAATRQEKKTCPTKRQNKQLDSDGPSHGRPLHSKPITTIDLLPRFLRCLQEPTRYGRIPGLDRIAFA
jgi:hypothetical protein